VRSSQGCRLSLSLVRAKGVTVQPPIKLVHWCLAHTAPASKEAVTQQVYSLPATAASCSSCAVSLASCPVFAALHGNLGHSLIAAALPPV